MPSGARSTASGTSSPWFSTRATTRAAIDGAGLTGWVIPITATPSSLPIPDGAVDLVHLDHVVSRHDLGDAFLAEVGRVLRAKGRLAVLDWEEVAADALVAGHGPPPGARVSAEQARSLIEGAGFAFAESVPAPEGRYAMVFDRS